VTVQLSVVVPTGNDEPDGRVQLTFSGFTPPDTVGAKVSGIGLPSVEYAVCCGQVIVGGGGGPVTTTTVLHEAVVLVASTAVHVTVVEPTGNSEPEACAHVVVTGAVPPPTAVLTCTLTGFPFGDGAAGALHVTCSGIGAADV
jgi:hypothetical protein